VLVFLFAALPPEYLRLQAFEERLNRRIVVAVAFAIHRWPLAVGLQFFW
jgi:hypothetical protein